MLSALSISSAFVYDYFYEQFDGFQINATIGELRRPLQ